MSERGGQKEKEREADALRAGLEEETAAIKRLETTAKEREEEDAAYEGSHS